MLEGVHMRVEDEVPATSWTGAKLGSPSIQVPKKDLLILTGCKALGYRDEGRFACGNNVTVVMEFLERMKGLRLVDAVRG